MVSLDQLRVFKAVVEHRGVTHAAEQLHFTQPAVSSQLRRLEHSLGVRLVQRNGRSVTPTDAGAVVYEYTCQILASADAMQGHVAAMVKGGVEHIVVGANGAAAAALPGIVVAFQRRHPSVQLSVIEAPSPGSWSVPIAARSTWAFFFRSTRRRAWKPGGWESKS